MPNYRAIVTLYDDSTDEVTAEVTTYDDDPHMAIERASHACLHTIPAQPSLLGDVTAFTGPQPGHPDGYQGLPARGSDRKGAGF